MNNKIIFNALKAELKSQEITQQEVSEHLNMENSNLWTTIRNGKIQMKNLIAICNFLKLDLYMVNEADETETNITENLLS
jgi:transcriptional regulator with XRE-family HTH domain|tara:strand:- start:87 stop:326 length:240 start_codon:yes stop_codon:yes gene_type:complete